MVQASSQRSQRRHAVGEIPMGRPRVEAERVHRSHKCIALSFYGNVGSVEGITVVERDDRSSLLRPNTLKDSLDPRVATRGAILGMIAVPEMFNVGLQVPVGVVDLKQRYDLCRCTHANFRVLTGTCVPLGDKWRRANNSRANLRRLISGRFRRCRTGYAHNLFRNFFWFQYKVYVSAFDGAFGHI